ncbi:unnamed protein product [Symbiodinium natans]|uniref:Uncharacterized protein n=1 Tax=Symbiodinium natans TaxID=878477 RepID=A0A812T6J8_9DINO|nr:unnamed protein product [Symbiodinium natans]
MGCSSSTPATAATTQPKEAKAEPKVEAKAEPKVEDKKPEPAAQEEGGDEVIDVKKGMAVTNLRRGQSGQVMQHTTTDVLVKYDDGKTEWTDIEDLKKMAEEKKAEEADVIDVSKGMAVTNLRRGQSGHVLQHTTTDVLVKYDDGKTEWTEIEDLKKMEAAGLAEVKLEGVGDPKGFCSCGFF